MVKLFPLLLLFSIGCNTSTTITPPESEPNLVEPLEHKGSFEKANDLYSQKRYVEAYHIYDSLSKLDSSNAELFFCKAKCEYVLKKDNDADRNLKYSIRLGHKVASSYYNLGDLHLFKNDSLAVIYFSEYLKEFPNDKLTRTLVNDAKKRLKEDALLKQKGRYIRS